MKAEQRTEYGFERNKCACEVCTNNCRFIPGMLVPDDLPRIAAATGYGEDIEAFAVEHLEASPGARVMDMRTGEIKRVMSLVPRRNGDGSCHWLDGNGRCTIHEVSPYGCAFFDHTTSAYDGQMRSAAGITEVRSALARPTPYRAAVNDLVARGQMSPTPEEKRARMQAAAEAAGKPRGRS